MLRRLRVTKTETIEQLSDGDNAVFAIKAGLACVSMADPELAVAALVERVQRRRSFCGCQFNSDSPEPCHECEADSAALELASGRVG